MSFDSAFPKLRVDAGPSIVSVFDIKSYYVHLVVYIPDVWFSTLEGPSLAGEGAMRGRG